MIRLVWASEADLPFIMATERGDGYDAFVGRWDEDQHRPALADNRYAYFVGYLKEKPVGFVILRDWASEDRVTLLKRIAVTCPNQEYGKALLKAVVDFVFNETPAHRFWLGVFPENARARRVYETVGFVAEGVSRGSVLFRGIFRDELIMAILRTDIHYD
jgi:RimJ/RimL family protein N-acetyltransferase